MRALSTRGTLQPSRGQRAPREGAGQPPALFLNRGQQPLSVETGDIFTEAVNRNAPRLPPRWKSECRRTRKLVYVCANSSHQTLCPPASAQSRPPPPPDR